MEQCCYVINSPHSIRSLYPIKFKVTCDYDNRRLIWLILEDTDTKKMIAKGAWQIPSKTKPNYN